MLDHSDLGRKAERIERIENVDTDYGDGDGVNDFDETYDDMQHDSSDFDFLEADESSIVNDSSVFEDKCRTDIRRKRDRHR